MWYMFDNGSESLEDLEFYVVWATNLVAAMDCLRVHLARRYDDDQIERVRFLMSLSDETQVYVF